MIPCNVHLLFVNITEITIWSVKNQERSSNHILALPSDPLTTIEKTTQNNDHNHESLDHMEETIQDSSNNYERLDHEEDIAEENNNASS